MTPAFGSEQHYIVDDPSRAALVCERQFGDGACTAYSRRTGVKVCSAPSSQSQVLELVQYGSGIALLDPASKTSTEAWLRTYALVLYKEKGEDKGRKFVGYVRRADVLLDTDLRRVTGCWPVKYIKDPSGGADYYPGETYFTIQGIASYPHHPVTIKEYGEQEVYYAEGVFTVRHKQYSNLGYLGHAVLDYPNHTVKFSGTTTLQEPGQVEWRSPDELKGCKEIPTVDPNSRAPNPKAYREFGG
jgi:hypothetical protein